MFIKMSTIVMFVKTSYMMSWCLYLSRFPYMGPKDKIEIQNKNKLKKGLPYMAYQ